MKYLPPLAEAGDDANLLAKRSKELRRHADHLRELRPRVPVPEILRQDLSLHNDVLFSWLIVCQAMLDLAAVFSSSRNLRFHDHGELMRNLAGFSEFPVAILQDLEWLPGFRDDLVHENSKLVLTRVLHAFDHLDSIEQLAEIIQRLEEGT